MAENKDAQPTQDELMQQIEEFKAQVAKQQEALKAMQTQSALRIIEGTFKAKVLENGEKVEKTFKFKDNYLFFRDEKSVILNAELLMKLANGETLTEQEITDYPYSAKHSKVSAQNELQRLASLEYTGLEVATEKKK